MTRIISLILIIIPMFCNQTQGQSLSLGFKYGAPTFQDWEFDKGTLKLRGATDARFYMAGFIDKEVGKGFSFGLGLDVLAANESVFLDKIGKAGSHKFAMFSISPKVMKEYFIFSEKFGISFGISFPVLLLDSDSFNYENDDSFRVIRVEQKDEFGNITMVPETDVVFSGERVVERKTSLFIRPEIGLFYNISEKLRITLSHIRGYNTGKPLISRNLDSIIYNGESFRSSDSFVGNYRSTNIGMSYRIF